MTLTIDGLESTWHVEVAPRPRGADGPRHDSTTWKSWLESGAAAVDANVDQIPAPRRRRAPSREDVLAVVGGGRSVSGVRSDSGVIRTAEGITVYPPIRLGGPWRAVWYDPDGRRRSCRATDEDAMAGKLEPIRRRLTGLPPLSRLPFATGAELVAYYLSPDRLPADRQWSSSYRASRERLCKKVLETIGQVQCRNIEVWHMQQIVNSANTATTGRHMHDLISGLVKAGMEAGFLSDPRLALVHWQAGDRSLPAPRARIVGHGADFVDPGGLPSHQGVAALAAATQTKRLAVWWREIMPYLAAYSGVRLGELLALTADDVDPVARTVAVVRQVIEAGGGQQVELPKGGLTRTVIYPATTPTGYHLEEQLNRRVAEARREREVGSNPRALLFPARAGRYLWRSSFWTNVVEPAIRQADWRDADGNGSWTWHTLRHVFCTTALNEWGLDLTDVTRLAGHSNSRITAERYLSTVTGVLERAFEKTRRSYQ